MKTTMSNLLCRALGVLIFSLLLTSLTVTCLAAGREIYTIKIYHLKDKTQEDRVDKFLQSAYIPALHKIGIKNVGVFKPVGNDTGADRRIFVFIPLKSVNDFLTLNDKLEKDKDYNTAGAEYLDAVYTNPPYTRMETIQLEAFPDMPQMQLPQLRGPKSERVYELRSYESATEKIHANKIDMFNKGGEVKLFKRLNFNAVFYSRVLAGSHMPNLMYMTTFENKADRDEHWKAFSADEEWKKISAMPQYKNNVSKNEQMFLTPTEYSDI